MLNLLNRRDAMTRGTAAAATAAAAAAAGRGEAEEAVKTSARARKRKRAQNDKWQARMKCRNVEVTTSFTAPLYGGSSAVVKRHGRNAREHARFECNLRGRLLSASLTRNLCNHLLRASYNVLNAVVTHIRKEDKTVK